MNRFLTVIILISILNSCNYKNQPEHKPNLHIPNDISLTDRIYGTINQ